MKSTCKLIALSLLSLFVCSCKNTDELSKSALRNTLTANAQELSVALNAISNSPGYLLMSTTVTSSQLNAFKSPSLDPLFDDSITLNDVKGIYDYSKANTYRNWRFSIYRFFEKTGESDHMIVRLPEEKVRYPRSLMVFNWADTLLQNNYIIDLSDYCWILNNKYLGYRMAATVNVKGVDVGALKIRNSVISDDNTLFTAGFTFTNGYNVSCKFSQGDTATSIYAISKNNKVLYEERYVAVKTDLQTKHRETDYSLTIGNVRIDRKLGINSLDSAKVYVNGILQTKSKVELIDIVKDSSTVCLTNRSREIKITFDDGTSTTIAQLLSGSIDNIRTLFISMRQTYFATAIVDRIAFNVFAFKNMND